MPFTYQYPRPALATDLVIFSFGGQDLQLLLIQRGQEPFKNRWALPGGFVEMDETLDQAAARELQEETGLEGVFLEQLHAFSAVDRDPRERVVSVAYYALVPQHRHALQAASDAADARWFPVGSLPSLAFDHAQIIRLAIDRLRHRLRSQPLGFDLLPRHFTLSLLQQLYEAVMGHELDKRNFRKKVLAYDLLIPLDRFQANVRHRAARLYRFDRKRYQQLSKTGFYFEVGS